VIIQRARVVRLSPTVCAAYAVTQALLLVVVLFPLLPVRLRVSPGDIAAQTITAPRSFSYSSAVVRQQLQQQAAAAVRDVIAYDVNVSNNQLTALDRALATLERYRADGAEPPAQVGDATQGGPIALSPGVRATLRSLSADEWTAVAAEAQRVLAGVLEEPFPAEELEAKRATVPARVSQQLQPAERDVVVALVQPLVQATEKVDSAATEAQRQRAIAAVPPQIRRFAANQDIVRQGEPIDASDIEALKAAGLLDAHLPVADLLAIASIAAAVSGLLGFYLMVTQPAALSSYRRLLLLAGAIAVVVLSAKIYFPLVLPDTHRRFLAFALPAALAPMLIASLFDTSTAALSAIVVAVLVAFAAIYVPQLSGDFGLTSLQLLQLLLAFVLSGLAGVYVLRRVDRMSRYLLAAGAVAGAGMVGALGAWWIEPGRRPEDLVWIALACAIGGALAALLTVGVIALLGPLFGITTRLELLELAQLNAPLLRRLQEEAPGTFQHSVLVGNLAERAADLIGADPVLVRVGCYYHDVGKLTRPGFFIENQFDAQNPHDQLLPAESARIIVSHVRDGDELARECGLPEAVRAFIREHHGTRMASYFYRKAVEYEANPAAAAFTYPGPRPESRETGIVMLADAVEAAARAAADRSQERLDAIVESVLDERMAEGQLDETNLTLRDLRVVAESFKASLRAIYHPRIDYPEPTDLEQARRRRLAGEAESSGD
jgi:putative nucleotidyltransferase with HDIG domain